MSFRKKD